MGKISRRREEGEQCFSSPSTASDNEHSLEGLSMLHPCFINIFAVIYGCVLFEKMCSLYHKAFLSVKRRFPYPLGILQPTVFCDA
jgi:hypothetical protein